MCGCSSNVPASSECFTLRLPGRRPGSAVHGLPPGGLVQLRVAGRGHLPVIGRGWVSMPLMSTHTWVQVLLIHTVSTPTWLQRPLPSGALAAATSTMAAVEQSCWYSVSRVEQSSIERRWKDPGVLLTCVVGLWN